MNSRATRRYAGIMLVLALLLGNAVTVASAPSLTDMTLRLYAEQQKQYDEGEGETNGEQNENGAEEGEAITLRDYASIGSVILLAFGILWLAEEPPSPCMVATAAYGTPLSAELTLLRMFRDQVLLASAFGTAFVDVYYRVGPASAMFIHSHDWAATGVRIALRPILAVAALSLLLVHSGLLTLFIPALLLAASFVVYWTRRSYAVRRAGRGSPLDSVVASRHKTM